MCAVKGDDEAYSQVMVAGKIESGRMAMTKDEGIAKE